MFKCRPIGYVHLINKSLKNLLVLQLPGIISSSMKVDLFNSMVKFPLT